MAGKNNDEHARALEALSAGSADQKEAHEQPPADAPVPQPSAPKLKARAASPIPTTPVAPSAKPAKIVGAVDRQLQNKRTIIPLLLTMGTLMPLAGVVSILMGEDSLIGEELTLPLTMVVLGLLILGVGVMTMLQVKSMLAQRAH